MGHVEAAEGHACAEGGACVEGAEARVYTATAGASEAAAGGEGADAEWLRDALGETEAALSASLVRPPITHTPRGTLHMATAPPPQHWS